MSLRSPFASLLLMLPISCGGAQLNTYGNMTCGYESLDRARYVDALDYFEAALAGLDRHHDAYLGAKLAQLTALANIDPVRMESALVAVHPGVGLTHNDYRLLAAELDRFAESEARIGREESVETTMKVAVQILELGAKAHPDFDDWARLIERANDRARILEFSYGSSFRCSLGYMGPYND